MGECFISVMNLFIVYYKQKYKYLYSSVGCIYQTFCKNQIYNKVQIIKILF